MQESASNLTSGHTVLSPIVSACPLCTNEDIFDTGFKATDHSSNFRHSVWHCRACTGRFIADRPSNIFKVSSNAPPPTELELERHRQHFLAKREADLFDYPFSLIPMIEHYSAGLRVLDLGCGASQLLPLLTQAGFSAIGFEGDPARAQIARENGMEIYCGDWANIAKIVGVDALDCIVSDQVFEHMLDPIGTVSALKSSLKENGILIFRFPNEGSMRRYLELAFCAMSGRKTPISYFVDHWNYFNSRSATTVLRLAGYDIIKVKKDFSLHGYLAKNIFKKLRWFPGLQILVARLVCSIDTNILSNGLTIVAKPARRAI